MSLEWDDSGIGKKKTSKKFKDESVSDMLVRTQLEFDKVLAEQAKKAEKKKAKESKHRIGDISLNTSREVGDIFNRGNSLMGGFSETRFLNNNEYDEAERLRRRIKRLLDGGEKLPSNDRRDMQLLRKDLWNAMKSR